MKSITHILNEGFTRKYLQEGIEDVKKYYQDIEDSKFMQIIALDPTYKEGVDKVGTYGKWLLNIYKKHNLKDEDFYKVTDYLKEFEEKRKWFKNKDIQQFKSLGELAKALDEVEVGELSNNQKDKQFKKEIKKANLNATKVFEDDEFEVWVPHEYVASCKLASNTEWCTGPSSKGNDNYYRMYSSQGPLYILLSKKNKDEKYQFHFESNQFMDRYDEYVSFVDFLNEHSEKLKDFFIQKIMKIIQEIFDDVDLSQDDNTKVTLYCDVEDMLDSDNISSYWRDSLDSKTINKILTYDLDFSAWDWVTVSDLCDFLNSNKEELLNNPLTKDYFKQLNINFEDISNSLGSSSTEVRDIIFDSFIDGANAGCAAEAYQYVTDSILLAYKKISGIEFEDIEPIWEGETSKIECTLSMKEIKRAALRWYLDEVIYNYASSPTSMKFTEVIDDLAASRFVCCEPRYGWQGFDMDTFIDSLGNNIDYYLNNK